MRLEPQGCFGWCGRLRRTQQLTVVSESRERRDHGLWREVLAVLPVSHEVLAAALLPHLPQQGCTA